MDDREGRDLARGDLSHRFTAMCVDQWKARGLPLAPLARMMIAHGTAMLCELEGDEAAVELLEQLAEGLEAGSPFAGEA